MLDHALCAKLKEHGFPLKDVRCGWCKANDHTSCTVCEDNNNEPTLSELIEECGKIILFWDGEQWVAAKPSSARLNWDSEDGVGWVDDAIVNPATGPTPEEAVAHLFIPLNPIK